MPEPISLSDRNIFVDFFFIPNFSLKFQGFDEEFVAANSEWVCRGACEWLTPAECRELVDNLKKHKENPSGVTRFNAS